MAERKPIISFRNFSFQYRAQTGLRAAGDCLEIYPGERVLIAGPSGSGKSTLAGCINGLNPFSNPGACTGTLTVDGVDAPHSSLFELSAHVGTVLQDPDGQFIGLTVGEDIAFALENSCTPQDEMHAITRHAAELVGIENHLGYAPHELSGGQKRRVAIAGVMAMHPRVLVLDEPAAGLDPEGRDDILSEVKEYHKKTGTTVLLVSHSMEDIAKYANRVLVMSNKKIAMYDTVEKVFARAPELLELGLSVPQVTKIFLKLREMGVDVPADVYTIPYAVKTLLEAKRRRDAGESLVLPRSAARKGGAV